MGQPLSQDLRTRVVAAVSGGLSRRAAAERFGVSAATAVRWVHAVSTTGSCRAKPQGGDTRKVFPSIKNVWGPKPDSLSVHPGTS